MWAVAAAAVNRRRDAIRRMTVRRAVASRVETNQAAASSKVDRAASSRAADKKKADRTKRPDAKLVLSKPEAHAQFSCKGISFVSLVISTDYADYTD